MGVKGLQTYVESCPSVFRRVNLAQMADDHRKTNGGAVPVIVVDGNNCLHFLVNKVEWVCGGQWDEYLEILRDFLEAFNKIGVKLVFFFDGLTPADKRKEWISRRHQQIERNKQFFSTVKASAFLHRNAFTVPAALLYAIPIILKYVLKATVYCNVDGECDRTIATFASENQCLAILAQDTDYIIYPTAPYVSMEHLDLKTMITRIYCREALCRQLQIQKWMLPLFACLVGTDYVSRVHLKAFNNRICANGFIYGESRMHTTVRCVAKYIAKYGAIGQANLPRYIPEIYGSLGIQHAISLEDFKKALDVYALDSKGSSGYIFPETKQVTTPNDKTIYDVLLRRVKNGEALPMTLDIICSGRKVSNPSLEDFNAGYKFPPCVLVYRPLRQRMYGLMFEFKDKYINKGMFVPHTGALLPASNAVEEWWVDPSKNDDVGKDVVLPILSKLPGILSNATLMRDIIIGVNDSEEWINKKWTIFMGCVKLTMSNATFLSIPHNYKSLCAILNYLIQKQDVPLELWEVEVFLIQCVHPKFGEKGFHKHLQVMGLSDLVDKKSLTNYMYFFPCYNSHHHPFSALPYNPRAVHLATLFLRGAEALFDLLWFCENPIGIEFFMPWHFFNGMLFHFIYKLMSVNRDAYKAQLSGESRIMFSQLMSATLEGINIQTSFPK